MSNLVGRILGWWARRQRDVVGWAHVERRSALLKSVTPYKDLEWWLDREEGL